MLWGVVGTLAGLSLRDFPIVADNDPEYLSAWNASAETLGWSIPARVPGDLISDLHRAGKVGNPLVEVNWLKDSALWHEHVWTYTTRFTVADPEVARTLVFDGVKMGAEIVLNGQRLGSAVDQYLRYSFEVQGVVKQGENTLEVVFNSSSMVDGRFMACSGGWDWAPFANTHFNDTTGDNLHYMSKGIWKDVYLLKHSGLVVEHVVPQILYLGEHPTAPLAPHKHGDFEVATRVHVRTNKALQATLRVTGSWGGHNTSTFSFRAGNSSVTIPLRVPASEISLWWPNGIGHQPLYSLNISLQPEEGATVTATRRVGFRHFALVTGDDTNATYVKEAAGAEGTSLHGMYWRVNGALVMSRGANMIPMEEMEGWYSAEAHVAQVQSAVDAHFNTLRVWGGGVFLPQVWYDACDEMGLLVYHDMQYAQEGHDPQVTASQDGELRHQIRRLSHHASIVMYDGCNECTVYMGAPTEIYAKFVMTVVVEEDISRVVWPSSPGKGWATGVHRLSSLPNGNPLTTPDTKATIEQHGPYQHGAGFPAKNGDTPMLLFPANIPLNLTAGTIGPAQQNVFVSEFGSVSMSSFESMAPTLAAKHWGLHAGQPWDTCEGVSSGERTCTGDNVMAQRNYPCDNVIVVYFGSALAGLNGTGEVAFKRQLYQCLISSALVVKQAIETRRAQNVFGLIVWQFGEIWPTGGWGSVEYGNPNFPGQVLGGRWKPLQYWYKSSLYADAFASCGAGGQCFLRNDAPAPFQGSLTLQLTDFASSAVQVLEQKNISLPAGAGAAEWFSSAKVGQHDGTKGILEAVVRDQRGGVVSWNVVPFVTPEKMELEENSLTVNPVVLADGTPAANLTCTKVAMFVTLTTLAHGRFEDNAFVLHPPGRVVQFVPVKPGMYKGQEELYREFATSLRVEDVMTYRPGQPVVRMV